jgi:hypothetical protein
MTSQEKANELEAIHCKKAEVFNEIIFNGSHLVIGLLVAKEYAIGRAEESLLHSLDSGRHEYWLEVAELLLNKISDYER